MPQIASAKKRVKVIERQSAENRLHRTRSRTALKEVRLLVASGKSKEAIVKIATAQSYLDKAAKKRAFHPNTVARYKARLSAAVKTAGNKDAIPKQSKAASKAATAKSGDKPAPNPKPDAKPAAKPAPKPKA